MISQIWCCTQFNTKLYKMHIKYIWYVSWSESNLTIQSIIMTHKTCFTIHYNIKFEYSKYICISSDRIWMQCGYPMLSLLLINILFNCITLHTNLIKSHNSEWITSEFITYVETIYNRKYISYNKYFLLKFQGPY